jgi:hypothetical protein
LCLKGRIKQPTPFPQLHKFPNPSVAYSLVKSKCPSQWRVLFIYLTIFLFFYISNDFLNSVWCSLEVSTIGWWMKWKGFGRKRSWSNQRQCPAIYVSDMKHPLGVANTVSIKIHNHNQHLQWVGYDCEYLQLMSFHLFPGSEERHGDCRWRSVCCRPMFKPRDLLFSQLQHLVRSYETQRTFYSYDYRGSSKLHNLQSTARRSLQGTATEVMAKTNRIRVVTVVNNEKCCEMWHRVAWCVYERVSVTYGMHPQGWELNPDDGGRCFFELLATVYQTIQRQIQKYCSLNASLLTEKATEIRTRAQIKCITSELQVMILTYIYQLIVFFWVGKLHYTRHKLKRSPSDQQQP